MRERKATMGIRQTALRLGFSLKYVYDLVYSGKLPAQKIARQWRIPTKAVEARLKQVKG